MNTGTITRINYDIYQQPLTFKNIEIDLKDVVIENQYLCKFSFDKLYENVIANQMIIDKCQILQFCGIIKISGPNPKVLEFPFDHYSTGLCWCSLKTQIFELTCYEDTIHTVEDNIIHASSPWNPIPFLIKHRRYVLSFDPNLSTITFCILMHHHHYRFIQNSSELCYNKYTDNIDPIWRTVDDESEQTIVIYTDDQYEIKCNKNGEAEIRTFL